MMMYKSLGSTKPAILVKPILNGIHKTIRSINANILNLYKRNTFRKGNKDLAHAPPKPDFTSVMY